MDTLHTVLRTISETKSETKSATGGAPPVPNGGRDPLIVFREFLRHLDRAHQRGATKADERVGSGTRPGVRPKRARKRRAAKG